MRKILLLFLLFGASIGYGQEEYKASAPSTDKKAFINSSNQETVNYNLESPDTIPQNIILFIGDGMGLAQIYAALTANYGHLNLENLFYIGFSKTYSANNYITDSGAGGTAIACGKKTYNGAIGVDENKLEIKSILHIAEENGLSTGVVSTCAVTHATPASFVAHEDSRNNYENIAADFLDVDIDVVMGGGKTHFTQRRDGRNLFEELKKKDYQVVENLVECPTEGKVYCITDDIHPPVAKLRNNFLEDATKKAIEILSQNEKGFFLMVEGSQIDWGGHQNNTSYVIEELLDMDKAIGAALEFASTNKRTLIILTADHETGGMSIVSGSITTGEVNCEYSTGGHTGIMVPVFAGGPGAKNFVGIYENTEIFYKMKNAIE